MTQTDLSVPVFPVRNNDETLILTPVYKNANPP